MMGLLTSRFECIGDYPLDEYAAAMNAWFYYKMYHWACQQMQQDIENTQESLDELNRDASVDNPMIVRDYLAASDEEKSLFEVSRLFFSAIMWTELMSSPFSTSRKCCKT
jgi:hypothetical protein